MIGGNRRQQVTRVSSPGKGAIGVIAGRPAEWLGDEWLIEVELKSEWLCFAAGTTVVWHTGSYLPIRKDPRC